MKFQSLLFAMLVAVLSFAQVPTITSLSSYSANVGDAVTITGTGFSTTAANNIVYFGSAKATITGTPTTTSIVVTVPAGSTYSPVSVTTGGLTGESSRSFSVKNTSIVPAIFGASSFGAGVDITSSSCNNTTLGSYANDRLLAVGDFDSDGKTDVVKAGTLAITVHRNISAPGTISTSSFAASQSFSTGLSSESPWSIQVADIDNDGKLDVLAGNQTSVTVFRNTSTTGTISFATAVNISTNACSNLRIGDIDKDGKKDIVVSSSYSSSVSIYLNTSTIGTISFNTTPTNITINSGTRHFELVYFNNDDKLDILATSQIILNSTNAAGLPTFSAGTTFSSLNGFNWSMGDFDNDGDNDIYSSYATGLQNTSTTTASGNAISGLSWNDYYWMTSGDVTGDGKLDMINTVNNGASSVRVYKNNFVTSMTEITEQIFYTVPKGDITTCDIDGDNKIDILISAAGLSSFQIRQNTMVPPPIIANPTTLSNFSTCAGTASSTQSTIISATGLSADITLTAPTGYEISLTSNSGFASSLTLTQSGGSVAATTIYVRLNSTAVAGTYNANLTAVSGTNTTNIALTGVINALPTITGSNILNVGSTLSLTGSATANASNPWISSNTSIATVNNSGLVTGVSGGQTTITYTNTNGCSKLQSVYVQVPVVYANSSTGNDVTGDGSQGNPVKSFNLAYQLVQTGGTINLSGTFDWTNTDETGDAVTTGYTIAKNLNIIGEGSNLTTIQADPAVNTTNRRVFTINAGVTVTIEKVTLKNGRVANLDNTVSNANGGAIFNDGTLTLNFCRFSSNYSLTAGAYSGGAGGAILHNANNTMTINSCTFDNNQAQNGGSLANNFNNASGRFVITNSTFAFNKQLATVATVGGGAIWILNATNIITNCTFYANELTTGTGAGASILVRQGSVRMKNNIFTNGKQGGVALGTYASEIDYAGGTATDDGNNIIGKQYAGVTTPQTTSYYDSYASTAAADGVFTKYNSSPAQNCSISISNTLALNGATNGTFTLATSGVSQNGGSDVANNGISIPTVDQRGVSRINQTDIGSYESNVTAPVISSTSNLSAFSTNLGTPSAEQSFSVSGTDLTANMTVTAPTGFEVSLTSGASFAASLTLTPATGTVSSTTIYIRLTGNTGGSLTGNVTVSSLCAGSQLIAVTGNVTVPIISATPSSLSGFSSCIGTESAAQSTSISGSNLTTDIVLTAPNGYEISLAAASGYGASLTLAQTAGAVSATTVYVRLKASATAGTYNLNLTATSVSTTNIALTGTMNGNVTTTSTNLPSIYNYTVGATVTALTFTSNYVTSYQWFSNTTNSTSGGTAISGATSATYTPLATAAELGTKFYYCQATGCNTALSGVGTVNVFRTYYSKASATDFNNVNSWGLNTDGTGATPTAIDNSGIFIIQNGAQLALSGNATVRALTISAGKLTVNSNTLTVSIFNQNNTELNVTNGGTLEITGGTVSVNGAAYFTDGAALTQTGGLLVLYPNSGTATTSVGGASGTTITFGIGYSTGGVNAPISTSANALKFNCTGGTIQIVDPTLTSNSNAVCFAYNGTGVYVNFGANHTVKFGDGISTLPCGHVNGFLTNFKAGTGYISFGNFVIDILSGTNRLVINAGSSICVTKNLTINSGIYKQNSDTYISGDLTNNGTFWGLVGALYFAKYENGVELPSDIAQTIDGNGLFKNAAATANFGTIVFNNSSAGGVTFANANTLKSDVSFGGTASAYLYMKNGVVNTGNNTFIHTQPNAVVYTAGGFGPGSTYARIYTTSGTGTTISAGTIPSWTTSSYGSYPFVSGNPVIGMKARHFHRSTAAMSVGGLVAVKYVESPGLSALPANITETVTYDVQTNSSWIVTTTATITGTATYCIQNQDGFPTSTSNVIIVRSGAQVGTASTGSSAPMGQRAGLSAANQVGTFTLATSTPSLNMTWTGATNTDWATASNWSPAIVPSASNATIPTSGITNYPVATNVTIAAGKTLNLLSGAQLSIDGVLTNNGTLTLESGATLVQTANSTLAGSGVYNIKQTISGAGSTTPTGRFWYLGSPVSTSSSAVLFASNASNVVKKRDEVNNAWTALSNGTPENLVVGKGYYIQAIPTSPTITFTGGTLNNSAITISGLTRTTGVNFEGFNLVSNPYPSYIDWDAVTKTNVGNTMWYRTNDGTSMVFETYVAGAAGGIGTNLSGNVATKLIPPMQAFWVRVNSGSSTGSITIDNSMRSHFTSISGSTAGLRSTNDELKLFLRMNLLQGESKDQLIVYVNGNATNGFDQLDGEKMMQATLPQFYTKAGDKKIVINGLNSAKKQQALPITMELPSTGVHTFEIENLEIESGLVWLEDTQAGTMEALTEGYSYQFYGEAGINSERFVLHFNLLDNTTPSAPNFGEVSSTSNFNGKGASVHAEAAGVVVIKLPASTEGNTDIQIRDAAGKLVYTGSTNTLETSVQLAQANGIYYVTLNSASGVEVRKVFIQQ